MNPTHSKLPADDIGRTSLILDIVAKETGVARDRLTFDAKLATLEIPSLDMVQTVFELGIAVQHRNPGRGGPRRRRVRHGGGTGRPRADRHRQPERSLTPPDRRAVVTGMGVVCATGLDAGAFLAALRAGRVGIGPIGNIPTSRLVSASPPRSQHSTRPRISSRGASPCSTAPRNWP